MSDARGRSRPRRDSRPSSRDRRNDDDFGKNIDVPKPAATSSIKDSEPLSLAEEIADEVDSRPANDPIGRLKDNEVQIAELQKMSMAELIEGARRENVNDVTGLKKQDLIFKILKERVKMNGLMFGEGTLEILPDGFGFLRSSDYHYLSCPDDIYVSPSQIRRFGLRTGSNGIGTNQATKRERTILCTLASRSGQLSRPEQDVGSGGF